MPMLGSQDEVDRRQNSDFQGPLGKEAGELFQNEYDVSVRESEKVQWMVIMAEKCCECS